MTRSLPTVPPGAPGSLLNADRRERDRDRVADTTVDLVVIGGGITGAGVALDAATRGLSVVLLEASDLAHGTSRWSSKLVHGGLRYLAKGQVGIAWESAQERARLMQHIAPHLTRPMAQVLPVLPGVNTALVTTGLLAADALRRATGSSLPAPRRIDRDEALGYAPNLSLGVEHAFLSWDGQLVDDARLVVAVARTAAAYGASILTYSKVLSVTDRQVGVVDSLTGEHWSLGARRVINATGAWADQLDPRVRLARSRGSHLVVPAERLGDAVAALAAPLPGSTSRFVFSLPQPDGLAFIGLTDEPTQEAVEHPVTQPGEVDFLLATLNTVLAHPLDGDDVITTFAGYRPLIAGDGESTADLSRRHAVVDGPLLSIVGGKLTTYRRMAADAVDRITDRPCRTAHLPLVGAAPHTAGAPRLVRRFGAEAELVARVHPGPLEPIEGTTVLPAELTWAWLAEGALEIDDVLDRRLRLDLAPHWRDLVEAQVRDLEPGSGYSSNNRGASGGAWPSAKATA